MKLLPWILVVLLSAILLYSHRQPVLVKTIRDTTIIKQIDTIRDTIPNPIYVSVIDSFEIPIRIPLLNDTIKDTIYLPIMQKIYRDNSYTAWISGYHANLDSIEVYNHTNTITIKEKAPSKLKRWSIGIHLGYGLNDKRISPYIGIGVSYNFFNGNI